MKPIFVIIHIIVLLLILLVTFAPVISVAIAGFIAQANGCTLNEGQVHPCIVNGVDQGETLYMMGVLGWFMLVTLPIGGAVFILYVLILVVYLIWKNRRNKADVQAGQVS